MYKIIFPKFYVDDKFAQFETESKGYLFGVKIQVENTIYELVFYDSVRLRQDSEDINKDCGYFHEPNLIILTEVTKESIEKAIACIYERNEIEYFLKS